MSPVPAILPAIAKQISSMLSILSVIYTNQDYRHAAIQAGIEPVNSWKFKILFEQNHFSGF